MGLLWPHFQANSVWRMRRGRECESSRGEADIVCERAHVEGVFMRVKGSEKVRATECKLCLRRICVKGGRLSLERIEGMNVCEKEREEKGKR